MLHGNARNIRIASTLWDYTALERMLLKWILYRLVTPHRGFSGLIYNTVWGTLAILLVAQFTINFRK